MTEGHGKGRCHLADHVHRCQEGNGLGKTFQVRDRSCFHFVVGDEDQCIYCWRRDNIDNIINFTKDYDCKIYKLEQNYRSTKEIIKVHKIKYQGRRKCDALFYLLYTCYNGLKKYLHAQNVSDSGSEVEIFFTVQLHPSCSTCRLLFLLSTLLRKPHPYQKRQGYRAYSG